MNREREPRADAPKLAVSMNLEIKPRKRAAGRRPKLRPKRWRAGSPTSELETEFRRIAFELTVPRARELLDELEGRLRELAHQLR